MKARNGPTKVYGECLMLRAERDPSSKLDFQIDAPPLSRLADHFCNKNWHETDMKTALRNVRFRGQSGKHMLASSFSGFGPEADIRRSMSDRM